MWYNNDMKSTLTEERGASMVEYALVLGALLAVFLAASSYLSDATEARYQSATNSVNSIVPCDTGMLAGDDCL